MTRPFSLNTDKNSPYWLVSFIGADGRQKRRSTKVPIAGGIWKEKKITKKGARKVAELEALAIVNEESRKEEKAKGGKSVREIMELVLKGKGKTLAASSFSKRVICARHFLEYLGKRADLPIASITKGDILNYAMERRGKVRRNTVKSEVEFLGQIFQYAEDAELIPRNPVRGIKISADAPWEQTQKEAFTLDEMRRMLEGLPPEWSAAVRVSFECYGLRISDTLNLKWEQVDWGNRVVTLKTKKTGRVMKQPMRESFYTWAWERHEKAQETGDEDAKEYICGSLWRKARASSDFVEELKKLGIGEETGSHEGSRQPRRNKSFHSIRATCATMLHVSGVSQAIAMELIGHNSAAIHRVYVKPLENELRACAEKMPEL